MASQGKARRSGVPRLVVFWETTQVMAVWCLAGENCSPQQSCAVGLISLVSRMRTLRQQWPRNLPRHTGWSLVFVAPGALLHSSCLLGEQRAHHLVCTPFAKAEASTLLARSPWHLPHLPLTTWATMHGVSMERTGAACVTRGESTPRLLHMEPFASVGHSCLCTLHSCPFGPGRVLRV